MRGDKRALTLIAAGLERVRSIDERGNVSYSGWESDEFEATLFSVLPFADDIPEIEHERIIIRTIFEAGKDKVTTESLVSALRVAEGEFRARGYQEFVLATTLSIDSWSKIPDIQLGGATVTFHRRMPEHIRRDEIEDVIERDRLHDPDRYLAVLVRVSARSNFEAVEIARDRLDLLRAFWNFYLNDRTMWRDASGLPPINDIRIGPLQTIHYPDGSFATEGTWWYELFSHQEQWPIRFDEQWLACEKWFIARLEAIEYANEMRRALLGYVRALDSRDFSSVLIRLWSILDVLTGRAGTATLIRRCVALFSAEEAPIRKMTLDHLNKCRNTIVHEARSPGQTEAFTFQLKAFVEELIAFHLENGRGKSLQETAAMLDGDEVTPALIPPRAKASHSSLK